MSSKTKGSKAAASRPGTGEAGPYEPDAAFQPVSLSQPKLDCSGVGLDDQQELWLLQLPLDFPVGAKVAWEVSEDAADGFRGRCTIDGVDYMLIPDQQALSADLFATPTSPAGSVVPIARRLTVVRATDAPAVCFGQTAEELAGAAAAPRPAAVASPADKKALKRKKADAAAAVPAPGAEAPGGTPAAADQQQQQEQPSEKKRKKEKSEKKRKKDEAAAGSDAAGAAAADGGSEKKKKKDKSAKKEKKDKKKDKS